MSVKTVLTAGEARVIACLIEKQITTPDQYPLSLNALTNACNQKSNRDPVLNLTETEVQQLLDALDADPGHKEYTKDVFTMLRRCADAEADALDAFVAGYMDELARIRQEASAGR